MISTALASRGTDLKLSKEANEKGGLHVLLTYLPKDRRTERQIFGRTGRKGLPGSTRQILCQEQVEEQLEQKVEVEVCSAWLNITRFNLCVGEKHAVVFERSHHVGL